MALDTSSFWLGQKARAIQCLLSHAASQDIGLARHERDERIRARRSLYQKPRPWSGPKASVHRPSSSNVEAAEIVTALCSRMGSTMLPQGEPRDAWMRFRRRIGRTPHRFPAQSVLTLASQSRFRG